MKSSVLLQPVNGGTSTAICESCGTAGEENRGTTPPLVSWSPDQKNVYLHYPEPSCQTVASALQPGKALPNLPASGLESANKAIALRGGRLIPQARAFGVANPEIYAFPRITAQRNIYRVRIP
jgi:hypothetical protein